MIYEKIDCPRTTTEGRHTNSVTLRVGGVSAPTEGGPASLGLVLGRVRRQVLSLGMGFCDEQTETRLRP